MGEGIRIYVADMAAYNRGKLHGVWIDADKDIEEIYAQVKTMLSNSPGGHSDEFAIHDFDGFKGYEVKEYESLDEVHAIACFIQEHGDLGAALINHYCGDLSQSREVMEYQYIGCYRSLDDFAEEFSEQFEVPQQLRYYIDYAQLGRDAELSGDIFTIETASEDMHIFWGQ